MNKRLTTTSLAAIFVSTSLALLQPVGGATPLAHWSFDETTGTSVADSARPDSPGTLSNTTGTLDAPGVFGGSGVRLGNTGNAYVSVPRFDMDQTSFTIAAWINPVSLTNQDEIFGDWSRPWQFRLYLQADGSVRANLRKDGPDDNNRNVIDIFTAADEIAVDTEWNHVALTWDRATREAKIYIDGEVAATKAAEPEPAEINLKTGDHATYQIGWKRDSGSNMFDGGMDELWVFDAALTETEINALIDNNAISGVSAPLFEITEIEYDPIADTISLTWTSVPGETYIVLFSTDMGEWDSDIGDALPADAGGTTTRTFDLSGTDISGATRSFFRVEKEQPR